MSSAETKRDRISQLLQDGLAPATIASIVGCHPSYVRVVRARDSDADHNARYLRRWRINNPEKNRATQARWRENKKRLSQIDEGPVDEHV